MNPVLLVDNDAPHSFVTAARTLRTSDLDSIYRETTPRLRAMMARRYNLSPHQCDDVLQQAWCTLLEKMDEVRDAGAWLAGTAINLSKQTITRCVRERPFEALPSVQRTYVHDESMTLAVRSALARIDERSRALCELIGIEGLSYEEVSTRLGLPIGSIGPMYIRAKERLRRAIAN